MSASEYQVMYQIEDDYFWYNALHHLLHQLIKKYSGDISARDLRIIDCGCGTGGALVKLLPHYPEIMAFDYSTDAIGCCRSRGLMNVKQMSITDIGFPSATFDIAYSMDVLCVLENALCAQALSEIRRILDKNGVFIFNLPAFEHLRSEHDEAVMIKRRFRRPKLAEELRAAGFRLEWINYRVTSLFPAISLMRLVKKKRLPQEQLAHSDLKPLPRIINRVLTQLLIAENVVVQKVPMPFGLSVFGVARKI